MKSYSRYPQENNEQSRTPKLCVLLSTYNGEKYLKQQLESLLLQGFNNMELIVRDDGSRDNTLKILGEFNGSIRLFSGTNIGVISSFFELLRNSPDADYFAFCDQDDYWKKNKVSRAVQKLSEISSDIPAMYCSKTELVIESLGEFKTKGYWPKTPKKPLSLSNALVENVAVGCTIVINKAAKKLLVSRQPEFSNIIMHDWWIYLCVSAFGVVVFDEVPHILYRQHSSNTLGVETNLLKKWHRRYQSFMVKSKTRNLQRQAYEFLKQYEDRLTNESKCIISKFVESRDKFSDRFRYMFTRDIYRQTFLEDLLLRVLIMLGKV